MRLKVTGYRLEVIARVSTSSVSCSSFSTSLSSVSISESASDGVSVRNRMRPLSFVLEVLCRSKLRVYIILHETLIPTPSLTLQPT